MLAAELERKQPPLSGEEETALAVTLEHLSATWGTMPPREQSRVAHLIIERVRFGADGKLTIELNLAGLATVAAEAAKNAARPHCAAAEGVLVIERLMPLRHMRKAQPLPARRIQRVSRIMALAVKLDQMVQDGAVAGYSDIARLGYVTRARVTQIMNLLHLAPDIQEDILFLPRVEEGLDPVTERDVRRIAAILDWRAQRGMWEELKTKMGS